MKTDIAALKRFISLPGEVTTATWQTDSMSGQPGGQDWWFAAVLEFPKEDQAKFLVGSARKKRVDFPKNLQLEGPFSDLKSLEGFESDNQKQERWCVPDTYAATPFESSPLLHGQAVPLGDDKVFVYMWTQ
jgi:hypothetical protein